MSNKDCQVEVHDSKHAKYIQDHLKVLRAQCNGFNQCLNELYAKENTLLILQGSDIELSHICSLVEPETGDETYTCSMNERAMIKEDLQKHLDELISEDDGNHDGFDHNHAALKQDEQHTESLRALNLLSHLDDDLEHSRNIRAKRLVEKDNTQHADLTTSIFHGMSTNSPKPGTGDEKRKEVHPDDYGDDIGLHPDKKDGEEDPNSKPRLDPKERHKKEWVELRKCIQEQYPNMGPVKAVCRSHNHNGTDNVCGSKSVHHAVESFFNKQLRHLQCTCDALPSGKSPFYFIVGGAAGGFVLMCLIILLLCIVVRRKRKKRQRNKTGPDGLQTRYHIRGTDDDASGYSEISDITLPLSKYRQAVVRQEETQRERRDSPGLPPRYAKVPTNKDNDYEDYVGSTEYLEPWDAPRFSLAEVNYDSEESNEANLEVPRDEANRASYFVQLENKPSDTNEDGGYETLTKKKGKNVAVVRANVVKENEPGDSSNGPDYFVLEKVVKPAS